MDVPTPGSYAVSISYYKIISYYMKYASHSDAPIGLSSSPRRFEK